MRPMGAMGKQGSGSVGISLGAHAARVPRRGPEGQTPYGKRSLCSPATSGRDRFDDGFQRKHIVRKEAETVLKAGLRRKSVPVFFAALPHKDPPYFRVARRKERPLAESAHTVRKEEEEAKRPFGNRFEKQSTLFDPHIPNAVHSARGSRKKSGAETVRVPFQ